MMRVLGIDPGSQNTGLGIIEDNQGEMKYLDCRTIKLAGRPMPIRLGMIYEGVGLMIDEYSPDVVSVEEVFFAKNPNSALVLGQARGSAICSAVTRKCEIVEYTALQIKQAVVGTGSAKKEQVQHMVRVILGLRFTPGSDEADALGSAICHIHTHQVQARLKQA